MKERNKKFFTLAIAFFIVSIMVASVLNFSLPTQNQQPALTYKGYDFYPVQSGWLTEINNQQIILTYNPQQLEDIFLNDLDLTTLKLSEKVYLSLNPNENDLIIAANDLIRNIQFPGIIQACPEESPGCENLPLKTCEDSTDSIGVIQFKNNENKTIVQLEKNCLFIQAPTYEITMLTNKIVYKELGIS